MSVSDNNKNRGAHGDSSFMLGGLPSSSENPPALAVGSVNKYRYNPKNLVSLINAANMTTEQAANNAGISAQSLYKYCSGYVSPGTEALVKLSDYFAVPADFLLCRCTPEEEKSILHNYGETFNLLRRAPWEAYLKTRKQSDPISADGYEAPWPYNLLGEISMDEWNDVLTDDQERGLDQALNMLSEREQDFLRMHFQTGRTFRTIAKDTKLSGERVRQIVARGIRKLRYPSLFNLVRYGADGMAKKNAINSRLEELSEAENQIVLVEGKLLQKAAELAERAAKQESDPMDFPLDAMYLNTRTHNALIRNGARTVRDVVLRLERGNIRTIRNLGDKGLEEILVKIQMMTGMDYRGLYYGGDDNATV